MTGANARPRVERSLRLALQVHVGQVYGPRMTYASHLADVVTVLDRFGVVEEPVVCAAWLHDAVEAAQDREADMGPLLLAQIRSEIGDDVARLVAAVTDPPGLPRSRRHLVTYPQIAATPGATALKLADRIANVEHGWRTRDGRLFMYHSEYPGFRSALFVPASRLPDPPSSPSHSASVLLPMWAHLDQLLAWRSTAPHG